MFQDEVGDSLLVVSAMYAKFDFFGLWKWPDYHQIVSLSSQEAVKTIFRKFIGQIRAGGHLILCGDRYILITSLTRLIHFMDWVDLASKFLTQIDTCWRFHTKKNLIFHRKHLLKENNQLCDIRLQQKIYAWCYFVGHCPLEQYSEDIIHILCRVHRLQFL